MRTLSCALSAGLIAVALPMAVSAKDSKEKVAKAEPLANPGSWFSDEDYPVAANLDGTEGKAGFKLGIGLDGRVADCAITVGSGSEVLDETTCTILKQRARFKPATNAKGVIVPGVYSGMITWRIPQNHAVRLTDQHKRLSLAFDVDEEGVVENCKIVENIGNATYVASLSRVVDPCEVMTTRNRPTPVLDAEGNAIKVHVETTTETKITPR